MSEDTASEQKTTDEPASGDNEGHNAPDEDREGDGQEYLDRSTLDFDPDDGLLSGTAVDGTSEIPGPHEDEISEGSDDAPRAEGDTGRPTPEGSDSA